MASYKTDAPGILMFPCGYRKTLLVAKANQYYVLTILREIDLYLPCSFSKQDLGNHKSLYYQDLMKSGRFY